MIPERNPDWSMYYGKGPSGKGQVLFVLEIPNNEILLTNYYSWSDYLFFFNDEYDEDAYKLSLKNLYTFNK
ncbi:hypothetical protein [Alkaliphilus sp. B6464]|uniref:hypothetical protein n=1 Tax=Alkaliphilus sp. B6464 TaxID=2731219 RepID=UPI001BAD5AE1|nr:hypothetical protein [Alkaliphilus sp. B6464]QUH21765.1 hypothetical protein HYG84_17670 [Alkaliphilus sp. B6464]